MRYKQNISNANFSVQSYLWIRNYTSICIWTDKSNYEQRDTFVTATGRGAAGEGGAVGNTEVLDKPPFPLSLSLLFWWSALNCLYSYSASSSATVTTIRHVGWHWRHGQGPSEYPSPPPGPESSALSNGFEQFDGSTCARPRHNSQHFPSVRLCVQLSSATTPIWRLTWAHVWWKICQSRAAAGGWGEQREGSQHCSLLQFACSFALSVSMLANLRIWMIGGSFCSLSLLWVKHKFFALYSRPALIYCQLIWLKCHNS